ncbi:MAG: DUF507 family protein [Nitrospiraceae bacterium]|nr:MAG: DUF507 family protein [Nitrospiraceae bacterium]
MKLTDDKISHLTHVVLKGLLEKHAVTPLEEEGQIRREIKRVIINELKIAEGIDEFVRKKLQSYSKKIHEGGSEWEIMYNKLYEEEAAKKGRG